MNSEYCNAICKFYLKSLDKLFKHYGMSKSDWLKKPHEAGKVCWIFPVRL